MLSIRMKRLGRKGHPTYRVVVQDSRWAPTSGKVVAFLGSYDPHTKINTLDKEKAAEFLKNGAQPSDRVVRLLKSEGVKLPSWVKVSEGQKRDTRNPDKLRKNRPVEEVAPEAEAPSEEEAPAETVAPEAEAPAEEVTAEEPKAE
jgi:small subunit ribosomal protein S16